MVYIKVNIF